jgi:hypothetical protein
MPRSAMNETEEGSTQTPESEGGAEGEDMAATQGPPKTEGKRTQLKIVRENIHSLSNDFGDFRKSHDVSVQKLQKEVAGLRRDLSSQTVSKDIGSFRKSHETSSKKLEKQVATLRSDVASLKASIAKDAARNRAKQEATLSKILAKVSVKPKAEKPKPSKSAKTAKSTKSAKKR